VNGEVAVFWISGGFSVAGAIGLVASRKAVHSALWVAFTMVNLAVLYFALEAPFLATTQIVVYTGAVMMLFLFVLMMVGIDSSDSMLETIRGQRLIAGILGLSLGALVLAGIAAATPSNVVGLLDANTGYGGNVQGLAKLIFGRYLLAFEVTSALLITAVLGAMVLAHRERWAPRKTQIELSKERVRSSKVTPLPSPGVIATSNSVDTPALLPDGTPAADSLPGRFQSNPERPNREVTS
jgi:NADH-quinone oxidoreductase subunit J